MSRVDLALSRRILIGRSLPRQYHAIAISPVLDEQFSDSLSIANVRYPRKNCGQNFESYSGKTCELFPLIVRVLRVCDWRSVWQMNFSQSVRKYGLSHSMNSFAIILHVLSLMRMYSKVQDILREILSYFINEHCNFFYFVSILASSSKGSVSLNGVFQILMKICAESKMINIAFYTFMEAQKIGIKINVYSCNFLLKCMLDGDKEEDGQILFDSMKKSGPFPNIHTYSIMMNFYSKRDVEKINQILAMMRSTGMKPTIVTYSIYIHHLCRFGIMELAVKVLHGLRCMKHGINNYVYNSVINRFLCQGRFDKAKLVLEEMINYGLSPSLYSYNILFNVSVKNEDHCERSDMINKMLNHGCDLSLITYTMLLDSMCKNGEMKNALDLFYRKILHKGYKLDQTVYNVLIDGYCKQGDMDRACNLWKQMIGNNLVPDIFNWTTLIYGYIKIGDIQVALKLFELMPDKNTVSYTALIHGLCKKGFVQKALVLFDEMLHQGPEPNLLTYNAIMCGLSKEGRSDMALEIFYSMRERGFIPDVFIYNSLIYSFVRELKLDEACMFLPQMIVDGIQPNNITYTILINGLCSACRLQEATSLFKEMIKEGVTPDKITYTSFIDGNCKSECMERANQLYDEMITLGLKPDVVTNTCMVAGYCKSGQMNNALFWIQRMEKMSSSPNLITLNALLAGYYKVGDWDEVFKMEKHIADLCKMTVT